MPTVTWPVTVTVTVAARAATIITIRARARWTRRAVGAARRAIRRSCRRRRRDGSPGRAAYPIWCGICVPPRRSPRRSSIYITSISGSRRRCICRAGERTTRVREKERENKRESWRSSSRVYQEWIRCQIVSLPSTTTTTTTTKPTDNSNNCNHNYNSNSNNYSNIQTEQQQQQQHLTLCVFLQVSRGV